MLYMSIFYGFKSHRSLVGDEGGRSIAENGLAGGYMVSRQTCNKDRKSLGIDWNIFNM